MQKEGKIEVRIRFRDTDCTGRIFFSKYFEYFDDAVLEFFREKGVNCTSFGEFIIDDTLNNKEKGLVIGDSYCRFLDVVLFDDILDVTTEIETLSEKKIVFKFSCYNKTRGNVCAQGHMTLIYINLKTKKSTPLPQGFLSKLGSDCSSK